MPVAGSTGHRSHATVGFPATAFNIMATLSVDVNGVRVATIGLTGLQVVDISVRGALDRASKAALSAFGGSYGEDGRGFLIWIDEHPLLVGDIVRIGLNDTHGIGDRGKTMQELYPDEALSTQTDFSISEDMAAQIRAMPRLHEAFVVHASTSCGEQASATSDDLNTDFTLGIVWDGFHRHQARLRLSTHCLDDVLARTGGKQHLETILSLGHSATFQLVR